MSFPPATEMFQFAGFASRTYGFSTGYSLLSGLPHSEIPGSPIARISPGLFAACCVLLRLSVPRHPPDALLLRSTTRPPRVSPQGPGPPPPAACPPQAREAAPQGGAYLLVQTLPLGNTPRPRARRRLTRTCPSVTSLLSSQSSNSKPKPSSSPSPPTARPTPLRSASS